MKSQNLMQVRGLACAVLAGSVTLVGTAAHAQVTISSEPTQNMTCGAGVCAPTATQASLNVKSLETMLKSGSVDVTTTGANGVQAGTIATSATLTWSSPNTLTLDAYQSVSIDSKVKVNGPGGVSLQTDDGGAGGFLSFGPKDSITFANVSSPLTINGAPFILVDSVAALAGAVTANPNGNYALSSSYDASVDGTYGISPVSTGFLGTFEGLGNAISNLTISTKGGAAMFAALGSGGTNGTIDGFNLVKVNVTSIASPTAEYIGGLVAQAGPGTVISNSSVSGTVTALGGTEGKVGGLVGSSFSAISNSYSTAKVTADIENSQVGGLVGEAVGVSYESITNSYATGAVTDTNFTSYVGGLVGAGGGVVSNSYATGQVKGGPFSYVGGLIGGLNGTVDQCFATGAVSVGRGTVKATGEVGGLVGDFGEGSISNCYATGSVSAAALEEWVGGLIGGLTAGDDSAVVATSYSTGAVSATGSDSLAGGFVGNDYSDGDGIAITDTYWDTTTGGQTRSAGNITNNADEPGITGLTTAEFQSGLPTGFDPATWGESSNTNNDFPYLLDNPPPQ